MIQEYLLPQIIIKKCNKCHEIKNINDFYTRKDNNKHYNICKTCYKDKQYLWIKNNLERKRYNQKRWKESNPEKIKQYSKKYYWQNPNKFRAKAIIWAKNNPEKIRLNLKKQNKKNRSTLKGKLDHHIGTSIWKALKGKKLGRKWKDLVGWDENNLILHLKKQFVGKNSWMNENNYGKKPGCWTVDHIRAKSRFHYETPEDIEFKKCWALENLQPMEWLENIKKSNKII